MQCPIDGTQLVMTDRQGIEIDYCPQCRGVWLDRGELDKIIERSAAMPPPAPQGYDDRGSCREERYDDRRGGYGKKRKKSGVSDLLGDIFDF